MTEVFPSKQCNHAKMVHHILHHDSSTGGTGGGRKKWLAFLYTFRSTQPSITLTTTTTRNRTVILLLLFPVKNRTEIGGATVESIQKYLNASILSSPFFLGVKKLKFRHKSCHRLNFQMTDFFFRAHSSNFLSKHFLDSPKKSIVFNRVNCAFLTLFVISY